MSKDDMGKNCVSCGACCSRDEDDPCASCLAVEKQTRRAYTHWHPKKEVAHADQI
jgi:hypothetical protein